MTPCQLSLTPRGVGLLVSSPVLELTMLAYVIANLMRVLNGAVRGDEIASRLRLGDKFSGVAGG